MPDFDARESVTVVVDGLEGWRGEYGELKRRGLSMVVSNIQQARFENKIEESIDQGMKPDDPWIAEWRKLGPSSPDSVCIVREGKRITTPEELQRMRFRR